MLLVAEKIRDAWFGSRPIGEVLAEPIDEHMLRLLDELHAHEEEFRRAMGRWRQRRQRHKEAA